MKSAKAIGLVMAVMLVSILALAGCTQTGTPAPTTAPAQTSQPTEQATASAAPPTVGPPTEISYWGYWCANATDGNYCEKLIEDALNINIKAVNISQNDSDQVNLMLTSGEMPDCGWFGKTIDYMYNTNGLTRTIPKDLVDQNCPGYVDLIGKNPILEKLVVTKEDANQYYALPTYQANAAGHQYFYTDMYRKDWLDKLGIAYPGDGTVTKVDDGVYMADKGFTQEQHTAILEAFTKNDPDGNGKNDTVGTIGTGWEGGNGLISWTLLGAYGLCDGFSLNDNGKAAYYYSTERFKQLLTYIKGLYQEGVVDPEIFTVTSEQFFEKAKSSFGGHFSTSVNWLGSWAMNRPPMNVLSNVTGSEILITPGIAGPNGQMGSRQWAAVPVWQNDFFFYVNKKVTDDSKLAKILQFVQFANFGEDKMQLMFGEPNVDYTLDAGGMPVRSTAFTEENKKGIQAYSCTIQDSNTLNWINDALFRNTAAFSLGDGKWIQYLIKPYKYDLNNSTQLTQLTNQYGSNLTTIVSEYATSVITGEKDLDATWSSYLSDLNNAGYDKICAELDKAPLYTDLVAAN